MKALSLLKCVLKNFMDQSIVHKHILNNAFKLIISKSYMFYSTPPSMYRIFIILSLISEISLSIKLLMTGVLSINLLKNFITFSLNSLRAIFSCFKLSSSSAKRSLLFSNTVLLPKALLSFLLFYFAL